MSGLQKEMLNVAENLDDIRKYLLPIGWFCFSVVHTDITKEAVSLVKESRVPEADELLANQYTGERIRYNLQQMSNLRSFKSRFPLAEKALIDYEEGRYHACIPVILAQIDGMVSDRKVEIDVDIPSSGNIDVYQENTPEKKLVEFITYWMKKNYGYIPKFFSSYYRDMTPGKARSSFSPHVITDFQITKIWDYDDSGCKISIICQSEGTDKIFEFNLQHLGPDEKILSRSNRKGEWFIIDWNCVA